MSVLPHNLTLFQLVGVWRPVNWSLGWKYFCYNVYSFIVVFTVFSSVFTEIVKLIGSYESLEKFLASVTILITMIADFAKAANILYKRGDILKMMQALISSPCSPRNSEEQSIQNKYDRIIRLRSLAYISLCATAVGLTVIESFFCDFPLQILTYNAWYPFNLSIYTNYLLAWIHQNVAHVYGALVSGGFDSFVSGFMLQTCAKFDILNYRLSNICYKIQNRSNKSGFDNKEKYMEEVIDCTKYHLTIIELSYSKTFLFFLFYRNWVQFISINIKKVPSQRQSCRRFSKYTNDTFSSVMLLQFSVSTGAICVTVYSLSQTTIGELDFLSVVTYLSAMLVQLFLFCYTGNEVTLKSADVAKTIYCNVDWWTTSVGVQKKLLFMMLRSTVLVTYTCGKIFDLSIESYKSVVKLSYSAYNVLQQS